MFFPFFFDWTIIILIPAILLAGYAQIKVKSTFNKYAKVSADSGLTGAQVAKKLLDEAGIYDVSIELTQGSLSDHYDPKKKVLRLSPEVYQRASLAALGVAAHETGHAIQHNVGYFPLELRSSFVPVASIGSSLAFPLLIIGVLLSSPSLAYIGIYAFSAAVLFQIITLPVEFNASNRAVAILEGGGYVSRQEVSGARKVLNAAALTYLAAALMAVLNLVRMLAIVGFFGGDD